MTKQADRYNDSKPQLSYIPLDFLSDAARVLEFGSRKYSRNNFRLGMTTNSLLDSLLRHVAALQSGEEIDSESGLPHVAHILCNAIFMNNPANKGHDDAEV